MQPRRNQIKQTTLPFPSKLNNQPRIFSHRKTKSSNLLQKKPQILLMKWNSFLQQYHMYKQLNSINQSLNMVGMHLKKKKQSLVIQDVPYIQSQQVSVDEKYVQDSLETSKANKHSKVQPIKISLNKSSKLKQSQKITKIQTSKKQDKLKQDSKQQKIVLSLQFTQQNNEQQKSQQNFTDQEVETSSIEEKQTKMQSTNKNSNVQYSFEDLQDLRQIQSKSSRIQEPTEVAEYLRKTACFSFNNNQEKQKQTKNINIQKQKFNQQNFNHLNKQIRTKKVQVLLKFQNQQQIRRQKAQKIIKEDRQYLTKIMSKR